MLKARKTFAEFNIHAYTHACYHNARSILDSIQELLFNMIFILFLDIDMFAEIIDTICQIS